MVPTYYQNNPKIYGLRPECKPHFIGKHHVYGQVSNRFHVDIGHYLQNGDIHQPGINLLVGPDFRLEMNREVSEDELNIKSIVREFCKLPREIKSEKGVLSQNLVFMPESLDLIPHFDFKNFIWPYPVQDTFDFFKVDPKIKFQDQIYTPRSKQDNTLKTDQEFELKVG